MGRRRTGCLLEGAGAPYIDTTAVVIGRGLRIENGRSDRVEQYRGGRRPRFLLKPSVYGYEFAD